MSKAVSFQCPTCGAPLDYAGGVEPTIRCPYCHTSVIVPEELRTKSTPTPSVVISYAPTAEVPGSSFTRLERRSGSKLVWIILAVALILTLVVGAIPFLGMLGAFGIMGAVMPKGVIPQEIDSLVTVAAQEVQSGGFASVALTFGGEGTGPGLFSDARHVAVDGQGNIYVGEYSDGRVQVFDPSGNFVSLFMVDAETPLRGLAADRKGIVYVVQGGNILRYEGASGKLLGPMAYPEGTGFDDVKVASDGGLVAAWYSNRDDIVRFDAQGVTVQTIREAISAASGDSELDTRVAVDGLGNIYALGTFNGAVFVFAPDGRFVTRFGGDGDEPGQFRAPLAIAVDGQGRVYVSDTKGIQVFDADGRYLDVIKVDGPAFGMIFNDHNELFVAARTRVIKYVIQSQ
jgi:sugar lactone lactonase YvrE/DNA-directed RNA polymerase subunit RPC12/RpoP